MALLTVIHLSHARIHRTILKVSSYLTYRVPMVGGLKVEQTRTWSCHSTGGYVHTKQMIPTKGTSSHARIEIRVKVGNNPVDVKDYGVAPKRSIVATPSPSCFN